ncbi:MAG: hypothetical protein ABI718_06005 [Acidobacteriota bacterium]
MKRWYALIVFMAATLAAMQPIRSYDYFWHLATGRWIFDHSAIPRTDPFALASARIPWINGEWLFQVVLYPFQHAFGHEGVSLGRAALLGLIFALGFRFAARIASPSFAALLVAVCWYGAVDRLGARPSSVAALLVVVAILILSSSLPAGWRAASYALLSIVWINVHPSALLAPVLAALWWFGSMIHGDERQPSSGGYRGVLVPAASALALLLNPFGLRGISAPLNLVSSVTSGAFVNAEWLPSSPVVFPLLYLTIVMAAVAFVKDGQWREHAGPLLILALLAVLSLQHVRNQGLYFAAYPLLCARAIPRMATERLKVIAAIATATLVLLVLVRHDFGSGIDRSVFPVNAVRQLETSGLQGNVYNPDQFGGYLIWNFYPQRRVLQDGRNELYADYLREYEAARLDGRKWKQLLVKYRLSLAIDEYHRESVDVVDFVTKRHRSVPVSRIYFPKSEWALIEFDDVAMVFARRADYPPAVLAPMEFAHLVPDAGTVDISSVEREAWRREIAVARARMGSLAVLDRMEAKLGK